MRCRAPMRKCLSHFGQTIRLASRSAFQIVWRQPSHLIQRLVTNTVYAPPIKLRE